MGVSWNQLSYRSTVLEFFYRFLLPLHVELIVGLENFPVLLLDHCFHLVDRHVDAIVEIAAPKDVVMATNRMPLHKKQNYSLYIVIF